MIGHVHLRFRPAALPQPPLFSTNPNNLVTSRRTRAGPCLQLVSCGSDSHLPAPASTPRPPSIVAQTLRGDERPAVTRRSSGKSEIIAACIVLHRHCYYSARPFWGPTLSSTTPARPDATPAICHRPCTGPYQVAEVPGARACPTQPPDAGLGRRLRIRIRMF